MTDKQQMLIWQIEQLANQLSTIRGQLSESLNDDNYDNCSDELRVFGHAINRLSATHHSLTHKLRSK